ncbi:MAG: hypothetical protein ABIW38_03190 [Ferruginibacter sp.]
MHLANLTTAQLKRIILLSFTSFIFLTSNAQENSPYSRYAMGDIVPNQNMASRGMGGIAAGVSDYQSINFVNPASLGNIFSTIFDLGGELDFRTLKSNISPDKFNSINTLISYLQVGFPITPKKMKAKGNSWGMSFGLRPLTRINYKIEDNKRLSGIDSISTLYEGSGGINQVNIGTGIKIKRFSVGINTGYSFGHKDYSTKINLINDSVIYYKSNTDAQTRFGGLFIDAGVQYEIPTKKGGLIRLGAYGNMQQKLKAKRDNLAATYSYDGNGNILYIDTIQYKKDQEGDIKIPASFGAGFTYSDKNRHWVAGLDIEMSNWQNYRYYGQKDATQNSWKIKAGAQYYPASGTTSASKYWSFVNYRAGIFYGNDYISLNNNKHPEYGVTLGAGIPLTSFQRLRFGEFVILNAGLEFGARGNKTSVSIRENIARFSLGVSMNARWFQNRKYD